MSTELIAILGLCITMIGIGAALAGLMLTGLSNLRKEMQSQRAETQTEFKAVHAEMQAEFKTQREIIISLLERVAHIEGLLEGQREASSSRREVVTEAAVAEDPGQYSG